MKQANGSFELTVPLPSSSGKLLYKYVVDGEWKLSPDDRIEKDESGIENNVLEESDFSTASKGSAIPEAGGLAYTPAAKGEAKATVMPTSETKQHSVAGEPGIHVPTDPEALAAFSTVRDVDAKALNEPELTAEEKKKQKKKVKRSQYKAKKKNKAAAATGAANNGDGTTEETSEFNSTPEPDAATKAVEEETAKDKKAEEVLGAAAVGTVTAGAAATLVSQVPVDDDATRRAYTEDPEPTPVTESAGTQTASEPAPVTSEPKASVAEPIAPVTAKSDAPVISETSAAPIEEPVASKEESKPSHSGAALGAGVLGAGAGAAGATAATGSSAPEVSKDSAPVSGHKDTPAPAAATKDTSVTEPVAAVIPVEENSKDLAGGDALSPVSPPQEVHTLDPKAQATEPSLPAEKEVAASPVDNADLPAAAPAGAAAVGASTAGAPEHIVKSVPPGGPNKVIEDEEIVIAQGNGTKKEIEAALAGQNGDVTLEEIQPTKSEAERLKEEAHISETTSSKSKTKPATTGAAASSGSPSKKTPATKTTSKPTNEEKKKKKGGFMAKLKKIFN